MHAKDTLGNNVVFKFRFWINNQSRMYLLEGTQKIRATYKLGPGDVIQFGKDNDGQLIVAGRKGTKGDQQRKPPASRGPSPANGAAGDKTQSTAKRKRAAQSGLIKPAQFSTDGGTYYFDPIKDGVFRAIPEGLSDDDAKVVRHNGVWSVVLNVCGELYQAYFDSSAAAYEAFNASGAFLPTA